MKSLLKAALVAATPASAVLADESYNARIDDHAPIGVMADHAHKKGEFMVSLRAMTMDMGDPVNSMMGPQSMSMTMLMAGMMYAPSDRLTLGAMVNYVDTSMDMIMGGNQMSMGASDIGDLRVSAIVPLMDDGEHRFLLTAGASVPTGSTDKTNPMNMPMALTMQPGTGSWGLTPSVTYVRFFDTWSVGAQASGKFWLDDNDRGERMGDEINLTSWAAIQADDKLSLSARLSYKDRKAVDGSMMHLLTDAREELWAFAGANVLVGHHRFAFEAGLPLWQDRGLNNLDMGVTLMVGWQRAF